MNTENQQGQPPIWKRLLHLSIVVAVVGTLAFVALRVLTSQLSQKDKPLELGGAPVPVQSRTLRGTYLALKNLNFKLTDEIEMKVHSLVGETIPFKKGAMTNFDDVNSFAIDIYQAEAEVDVKILQYIFNQIVFNYEGTPLKNLKMEFINVENDGKTEKRLKLSGDMKLVFWLGFEMIGKMYLDKENVLLIIEAESIKSLGNPMTKTMLDIVGLDLEKLLPIPRGRGLVMKENKIIVEPFSIFPPPKIGGYLSEIKLLDNSLWLKIDNEFKVKFPPLPDPKAANYLMLYKGDVKFGKLRMIDAYLQMIDQDQKDIFDFYLKKYTRPLGFGYSKIRPDGSVLAYIPDYNDTFTKGK
ncbi:MAG: hypothetical protein KDK41_08520 [Leptospiraceae bacterium]|nr:hypothetical protein [Leptospiraceae bacterium]MCB1200676.1 hypothetical protein [Leptospiraceae bacterium]